MVLLVANSRLSEGIAIQYTMWSAGLRSTLCYDGKSHSRKSVTVFSSAATRARWRATWAIMYLFCGMRPVFCGPMSLER